MKNIVSHIASYLVAPLNLSYLSTKNCLRMGFKAMR